MNAAICPKVTIIAFDGSLEMSIVISRDLFYAGTVALKKLKQLTPESKFSDRVVVASQNGAPVTTFSGSTLEADAAIADIEQTELILVSGIWQEMTGFLSKHQPTVDWLKHQYNNGAIIACLHTGSFLVAEAGLLDGKAATIYWRMAEQFKSRYPKVILQVEKNVTAADRVFCSSGIASGVELGIFVLERIWGINVATTVARNFMMDIPRGPAEFQLPLDKQKQHDDTKILAAQQWMESNFSSDFLIDEVADKFALGLRNFRLRFKQATGDTPIQYLHRLRIETAKQLLSGDALSIEQIAYRVGYDDASYFSRLFKRKTQQTPGEYRTAKLT